jgi:hypothetical protein
MLKLRKYFEFGGEKNDCVRLRMQHSIDRLKRAVYYCLALLGGRFLPAKGVRHSVHGGIHKTELEDFFKCVHNSIIRASASSATHCIILLRSLVGVGGVKIISLTAEC